MRPKKVSDQDILSIARDCLLEQGSGVSTQLIAERIGVSQATIFKRFGTKVQLLQAALLIPIRSKSFLQLLEKPPTDEPIIEQLKKLAISMLHFYDEMIPCWSVLCAAGLHYKDIAVHESPAVKGRHALTRWIACFQKRNEIRQDVEAESIAVALIGAIQHRPFRRYVLKDTTMQRTDEEYINSIVEVLWQGLMPKGDK